MTQRAHFEMREAWMGKDFGENYARRLFGDEVVDALPRYVKGKNAGKFKTTVRWIKVEEGGWDRAGGGVVAGGRVENRVGKVIASDIVIKPWGGGKPEVLHSQGETARFALYD